MNNPIRKCIDCDLKAWIEEDLEQFRKNKGSKYGRLNLCKKCDSKRIRAYRRKNKSYLYKLLHNDNRVYLTYDPRENICSFCGLKYPEELGKQTSFHHWIYHKTDPFAYSIELCDSCHMRLEAVIRRVMRKGSLRKCRVCGLEANTDEDLDLFAYNPNSLYDRDNICRECRKITRRGKYAKKKK